MERDQLEGWKDIARYLGRSVRTVQLWERDLGLPVHRIQARVFAAPADLDRWRQAQRLTSQTAPAEPLEAEEYTSAAVGIARQADGSPRKLRWLVAAAVLVAGVGAGLFAVSRGGAGGRGPVRDAVDGQILTALDVENEPVFRYRLPAPPWGYVFGEHDPRDYPRTHFADLDGDGQNEVLYVFWAPDMTANGTDLYCFGSDGAVRWKRKMGRALKTTDGREMSASFHTSTLGVLS